MCAAPSRPLSLGSVVGEKYQLEAVIGSGGMGTVMRARAHGLTQPVAIKFVKLSGLTPRDAAQRLLREAAAAARLTSPHVVKILDVGHTEDGTPFVVMELLQGESFAARLRARGRFPLALGCHLLQQVCLAIAEAHEHGIIHRDLKPQNLFVCRLPSGEEIAKVLDFGLAKTLLDSGAASNETTSKSVVLGSPAYMSPEQIRFRSRLDHRTDIWSLGVVMRELFTGELPFTGTWSGEIFASVLSDLPKPMLEVRSDIPPELERAVARCLRKDPGERFADATELANVLGELARRTSIPDSLLNQDGEPVAAAALHADGAVTITARRE